MISSRFVLAITIIFAVAVTLMAIDGRSFWIDELGTWAVANFPDLPHWWSALLNNRSADGQQPVYHLFMYGWVKLFGDTERAMRLSNLPWFVLGCTALAISAVPPRLRLTWVAVVLALAPTWYYLNEARPYMMFFAGAAWLCAGWIGLARAGLEKLPLSRTDFALYTIGCLLILSATTLGVIWIASSVLGLALVLYPRWLDVWKMAWASRGLIVICTILAAVILAVVARNFLHGGRASTRGFSFESVIYGLLEVAGGAGLGPARNDLRGGLNHIPVAGLAAMGTFGLLALVVVFSALRRLELRAAAAAGAACLLPLGLIVFVSYFLGWRAVGRHFLPLMLPISLAYAAEIEQAIARGGWRRIVVPLTVVGLLISTARIRFSAEYTKDDYADASNYVRPYLAQSKVVMWAADPVGAAYYHLIGMEEGKRPFLETKSGMTFRLPSQVPPPDHVPPPVLVVYSKPDIYDPGDVVAQYITANGMTCVARFPSFEIFALPGTSVVPPRKGS